MAMSPVGRVGKGDRLHSLAAIFVCGCMTAVTVTSPPVPVAVVGAKVVHTVSGFMRLAESYPRFDHDQSPRFLDLVPDGRYVVVQGITKEVALRSILLVLMSGGAPLPRETAHRLIQGAFNCEVWIRLKTSISAPALYGGALTEEDPQLRYLRRCWSAEHLVSGKVMDEPFQTKIQEYVNEVLGIRQKKEVS